MVVNYQIESTPLSNIIANLNSFATLPTTSKGAGEIIHYSGVNSIRWNSQTVDPTTNPIWSELGAGGGDFYADGSVPMTGALVMGTNNITGIGATSHGAAATFATTDGGTFTFKALTTTILSFTKTLITFNQPISSNENITLSSKLIRGLSNGSLSSDAVNKGYIDTADALAYLKDGSVQLTGDLSFNKATPAITFDSLDEIRYDKTTNTMSFVIGNAIMCFINGSSFDVNSNKITNLATPTADSDAATKGYADTLPGVDGVSFIIDQDNAGAGVSSSLRFNRGSTDGDAAIWWDEGDDEFQFESDVGVTVGSILIDECRHGGSVKTSRNPSTGDYEIEVASGDSIVFKAV